MILRIPEIDLYKLLGVSPLVTQDDIKRAYRSLMRRFHPDVAAQGFEPYADEISKQLNEAYEWLSDPRKRSVYDFHYSQRRHVEFKPSEVDEFKQKFGFLELKDTSRVTLRVKEEEWKRRPILIVPYLTIREENEISIVDGFNLRDYIFQNYSN